MMAAERVKARKGFEYKMSKKVAELTQVVHMLFIRNHEREVEIQMTKDLYREEMKRTHKNNQLQIDQLESKVKSLTDKSKSDQTEEAIKAKIEQSLLELESRWSKKYDSKENECQAERTTNSALKEKLTKTEAELSALRSSTDDSSATYNTQLASKEKEIDRLHKHMSALEKKLADEIIRVEEITHNLERSLTEKHEEIQNLRTMLDEAQGNESALNRRLQNTEKELKNLKRELTRRSTADFTATRGSAVVHTPPDQSFAPQEVYEELEHLRKLVQKYRLELSNREGNFNRMFTEKTPVHVDQRTARTLAPLPLKAVVRDKSLLNQSTEPVMDSDRKLALAQPRADSGLSRRSTTLTGIRRNVPPPGGRQLLAQYNQQHNFKA